MKVKIEVVDLNKNSSHNYNPDYPDMVYGRTTLFFLMCGIFMIGVACGLIERMVIS